MKTILRKLGIVLLIVSLLMGSLGLENIWADSLEEIYSEEGKIIFLDGEEGGKNNFLRWGRRFNRIRNRR